MSEGELVNYYDTDGTLIGVVDRETANRENLILGAAVAFLFDPKLGLWLQKRRDDQSFPSQFCATSTGAAINHESLDAATDREFEEETKLIIAEIGLVFLRSEPYMQDYMDGSIKRTVNKQVSVGMSEAWPVETPEVGEFLYMPSLHDARRGIEVGDIPAIDSLYDELGVAKPLLREL